MANKYPTKEEILTTKPDFEDGIIWRTSVWRYLIMDNWPALDNHEKIMSLQYLIDSLCYYSKGKRPNVEWGDEYSYDTKKKIITLDTMNPSIISTLHEIGHHFKGESELLACQWSVHLFIEIFPDFYRQLQWKGHLLVKK